MKFAVGQKLWFRYSGGSGGGEEITITSVGRKWAYFKRWAHTEWRISADGRVLDGSAHATYCGQVYASEKVYQDVYALNRAWTDLLSDLRDLQYRKQPPDISHDVIGAVRELLNLPNKRDEKR